MIELNDIGASAFIVSRRADDQFVYDTINTAAERMTGLSNADVSGRLLTQLFREDVASMLAANYAACLHDRTPVEFERTVPLPLGKLTVRTTLTPIFDAGIHGPVTRLLGVAIDITDQHRIQEGLKSTNARLAIAMDALGGAHWYFDVRQKRFELSPGFDRILGGNSPSSMALEEWLCRVHPDDREDTCFADILAGRSEQGMAEFRVIANSGDVRWLRCRRRAVQSGPTLTGIAGVVLDVTQEKRREATLSLQAASDPLTGLANRRRFEEVFAAEREQAALCHSALSLLMVDVDHFKAYNDTYGNLHQVHGREGRRDRGALWRRRVRRSPAGTRLRLGRESGGSDPGRGGSPRRAPQRESARDLIGQHRCRRSPRCRREERSQSDSPGRRSTLPCQE